MAKPELCVESSCALAKSGAGFTEVEIGARYEQTRLLFVGEASGEAEARESLPFRPYAQSGSLLSDAMREVNVGRSEVAVTNILRCRPPKDWLEGAPWSYSAISHCTTNYLIDVIRDLKPHAILALGGTAFRALTNAPKGKYGTLDYARGYVQRGAGAADGVPVIATYHPAYLRRGAAHLTPLLQRDIRRAFLLATGKLLEGRHWAVELGTLGLRYQTAPTIEEAWEWARSADPKLKLSYDLETPMSTRSDEDERTSFTDRDIKLAQFTQRRGEAIALPWREEYVDVARAIFSRCPRKVGFNNWNFDDEVLRANGIDVGVTDDAMVKFGSYWSDLPKNLQAAAQMCGFPFPWKALGETDLPFYGCADVDAALCVDDHMDRVLEGELIA
jgi:uracil-DNA glycosylase family 4